MDIVKAPVIRERAEDYDKIEKELGDVFRDEIYIPLMDVVEGDDKKLLNDNRSFLVQKINDGVINYYRGKFTGKFSSLSSLELREIGAVWDRKEQAYKLPSEKLPADIKMAISTSASKFDKVVANIKRKLAKMLPEKIAEKFKGTKLFDNALWKTDGDLDRSLQGIAVMPQLSDEARLKVAEEYNQNMHRYIQNWTEKEIENLRELVSEEALKGKRYESLISIIEKRYNVSQNKAKFLARQETSLMLSKFKEARYVDAGSPGYIWRTVVGSPGHPVRQMHKELDGKFFTWDNPPVTNEKGDRNHPGEDYNCRCTAQAVIKF